MDVGYFTIRTKANVDLVKHLLLILDTVSGQTFGNLRVTGKLRRHVLGFVPLDEVPEGRGLAPLTFGPGGILAAIDAPTKQAGLFAGGLYGPGREGSYSVSALGAIVAVIQKERTSALGMPRCRREDAQPKS